MLTWRLFARREEESGIFSIIKWWELRRLPFNLAVGATGFVTVIVTLAVAVITSEKFDEPLGLPDPPIIALFAVIGYGIGANVCFTVGWVAEILVKTIWRERAGAFGQIHFVFGLVFSILLTLTPAVLFTGLLFLRVLRR